MNLKIILATSTLFVAYGPPANSAIVGGFNVDFSAAPFVIDDVPGGAFTFYNVQTAPFDFDAVGITTSGGAQVTSFGGFLGIPLQPSTFFTRANVEIGPDTFIQWASFADITPIPGSLVESDLGLRIASGGDFFYGYARFAGPTLISYAFQTEPNVPIVAGTPASVPEPASALLALPGLLGCACLYRGRSRSLARSR